MSGSSSFKLSLLRQYAFHICCAVASLSSAIALLCLLFENAPLERYRNKAEEENGKISDLLQQNYDNGVKHGVTSCVAVLLFVTTILLTLDIWNYPSSILYSLLASTGPFVGIIIIITANPVFSVCEDTSMYLDSYVATIILSCIVYSIALVFIVRMFMYRRLLQK